MLWPIVIDKDDDSDFGVTVPDLPGCFSAGDTFEDAINQVKEAIELHLEGLLDEGMDIPIPGNIDKHRQQPEYAEGVWALVEIDDNLASSKTERINLSIPAWANARIEKHATKLGKSKSKFMMEASLKAIDI